MKFKLCCTLLVLTAMFPTAVISQEELPADWAKLPQAERDRYCVYYERDKGRQVVFTEGAEICISDVRMLQCQRSGGRVKWSGTTTNCKTSKHW